MTITAAVSTGDAPGHGLDRAWAGHLARGDAAIVRHGSTAVGWSTRCRWVDAHDDGDLLIVLDGLLHDFEAVGSQAEALAARWRSTTAPHVRFAEGLAGDFVAIAFERSTGTVAVARDPLGVRPWYQAATGGRHAGASEVATLTSLPWVDAEVDEVSAIRHLAGLSTSTGRTLHRGVATLAPGTTWSLRDGAVRRHRHHRWELRADVGTTWEEAVERCRHELDGAVRRRLAVMDGPASEISGGLDSSAVVGTAVGLGHDDLVVGRLVFDGCHADERPWSDAVIDLWHPAVVSAPPWIPGGDEALELTARSGRPLPDPHFTMFAGLRRALLEARRPYALTGLGGDDAFVTSGMGAVLVSAVQLHQWRVLGRAARATVRTPREAWTALHRPLLHHLAWWRGDRLPGWVTARAVGLGDLNSWSRRRPVAVTGIAAIDERASNLTDGYEAAILESQAVVADLVGARVTHPFLDPALIEATYGLDPTWPTRGDHDRALEVAAYRDRIPAVVARRRSKADFSEVFWPQVLADATLADVRRGPLVELGWLDPGGFEHLVAGARRGMANAAIPLSRCVSLDRWLRSLSR